MFESFSSHALEILRNARRQARLMRQTQVDDLHVLCSLLHNPTGIAAGVLLAHGVDARVLRRRIQQAMPLGDDDGEQRKREPTPLVNRALDWAVMEARAFNHTAVEAEHLLLGLIALDEGAAAPFFAREGLTLVTVRNQILALSGSLKFKWHSKDREPRICLFEVSAGLQSSWVEAENPIDAICIWRDHERRRCQHRRACTDLYPESVRLVHYGPVLRVIPPAAASAPAQQRNA